MCYSLLDNAYAHSQEVIAGTGYTYSADVWSIGIILHEIIEGDPPYMEFPPIKVRFHCLLLLLWMLTLRRCI